MVARSKADFAHRKARLSGSFGPQDRRRAVSPPKKYGPCRPECSVEREARSTAAGGFRVRIAYREVAAHQLIGVVKFRASQQVEADGVDDHAGWTSLNDQVVGLGLRVQLETILQTTASPGQYGHAEGGFGVRLRLGDDFSDPGGGSIGNGELFHDA